VARSKKSQKNKSAETVAEDVVLSPQDAVSEGVHEAGAVDDASHVETDGTAEVEVIADTDEVEVEELDAATSDIPHDDDVTADEAASTSEEEQADVSEDTAAIAPTAEPQVIIKKRGFFPMLVGGVLCACLGYGGANFLKPEGWPFPGANTGDTTARIEALEKTLADAQAREAETATLLEALREEITADVDAKLADVDIAAQLAPLQGSIEAMSSRLTTVEAAPVAEAIVSPEATAAYETQLAQMQQLLDEEVARLTDAKVAAENEEANAAKASAAARLQEAVATGMPFAAVLENIEVDVPDALRAHADQGVASLQTLADEFSTAADQAIAETAKLPSEDQTILDKFLRTQLGLRSLTPQDGTSADAILSRAEQAIRDIDLQTALTEISTLPEVGQTVLADWTARAQARLSVTSALSSMLAQ
jgi:hypothetical protein